jgi:hypothetical protein
MLILTSQQNQFHPFPTETEATVMGATFICPRREHLTTRGHHLKYYRCSIIRDALSHVNGKRGVGFSGEVGYAVLYSIDQQMVVALRR